MAAGGHKVDARVFQELRKKLGSMADAYVKVGVLQAAGGAPHAGGGDVTLAEVAAFHELGLGVPERSFIRATFEDREVQEAQRATSATLARGLIAERMSVQQALQRLGLWAVAQIKKRIKDHIPPPLKQATIDRKGSSTPLVDTGQLINSITFEVKEK